MIWRCSCFLLLAFSLLPQVWAQHQRDFTTFNDYGDGTVQTFVAEYNQAIAGVRLLIQPRGIGNDVTVHIRDLLPNGTLSQTLLASGVLDMWGVLMNVPTLQVVKFDNPFTMVLGNDYGIVINQFGSGGGNFIEYGVSVIAPYQAGSLQYEFPVGAVLRPFTPNADLTFELVGVPEPTALTLLCFGSVCLLRRGHGPNLCEGTA